jgi:uncharacterized protein (TIGR02117 family)
MKKVILMIVKTIAFFIIAILIYFLSAFCLSRILVDKEKMSDSDVTIYILSNGVHTDIVLPTKTNSFNWTNLINPKNTISKDTTLNYIAFGWGDKGFYLETPTWNDLKFSTAFKAAFGLSESAMHVTYYKFINENETCKSITLSEEQYLRLVKYIKQSILLNKNGEALIIKTSLVYGINDAFYEANGNYSVFKTCNTWANNALKVCGQNACFWTPFESGIFYHYK